MKLNMKIFHKFFYAGETENAKCSLSVMDGVLEGIRDVLINLKYTVDINK